MEESDQNKRRWFIKRSCIHYNHRPLPISGHVIWSRQSTCHIPRLYGWSTTWVLPIGCSGIHWQHPYLFRLYSMHEHQHHVAEVLQRLRNYQLIFKAKKLCFHQSSVQFLGYNISQVCVTMNEMKVRTVHTHNYQSLSTLSTAVLSRISAVQFIHQTSSL